MRIFLWLSWTAGVLLLTQFLLSFPFSALYQNTSISLAAAQTLYSASSYLVAFFIIVFVPKKLQKSRLAETLHKAKSSHQTKALRKTETLHQAESLRQTLHLVGLPTWTDLGLALVGFVTYTVLAALLTSLFSVFPWFDATQAQDVGYNTVILGADRIFAFFALVIVAPLAEELIFRGFLYTKVKNVLMTRSATASKNKTQDAKSNSSIQKTARRRELIAIIITSLLVSLLFAALHGQWNVGVNVFVLSLVLCALREITGTIYSGILVHIIKNLIAFYILFIMI